MNLHTIQWEYPAYLWGLAVLPLLGYLIWRQWRHQIRLVREWSQVPESLAHTTRPSVQNLLGRTALLVSSWSLAILGFTSPTLPLRTWEPAWERVAIGLVLDVSRSMQAPTDALDPTSGTRLELLQQTVREFITELPNEVRIGVITVAGVAVPLVASSSSDHQSVWAKVRRLKPGFIQHPGTDLAAAIQQGHHLFAEPAPQSPAGAAALVLLSDGDTSLSPALQTAIEQATLPIYTLGMGTLQPARLSIPTRAVGQMIQTSTTAVNTTVNASLLRTIAEQTGGAYYPFTDRGELREVLRQIIDHQRRQVLQPKSHPQSIRRFCFLGAFISLGMLQFLTRPRRMRNAECGMRNERS